MLEETNKHFSLDDKNICSRLGDIQREGKVKQIRQEIDYCGLTFGPTLQLQDLHEGLKAEAVTVLGHVAANTSASYELIPSCLQKKNIKKLYKSHLDSWTEQFVVSL
jgi:hypothetical protein